MSYDELFSEIRSCCSDSEWSEAVKMSRQAVFVKESESNEEVVILVAIDSSAAAVKVTLWPGAVDWDCESCEYEGLIVSAAAAIACKHGKLSGGASSLEGLLRYKLVSVEDSDKTLRQEQPQTHYKMFGLEMRRYVLGSGSMERIPGSLTNYVGGIKAGRIKGTAPVVSQVDYRVDEILDRYRSGHLPSAISFRLLKELKNVHSLMFEDKALAVSSDDVRLRVYISRSQSGYLLRLVEAQVFVLSSLVIQNGVLYFLKSEIQDLLKEAVGHGQPVVIRSDRVAQFVSEVFPKIERYFEVTGERFVLPKLIDVEPVLIFEVVSNVGGLTIIPKIVYGDPVLAEVGDRELNLISQNDIPVRLLDSEQELRKKALNKYSMLVNRQRSYSGSEVPEVISRLRDEKIVGDLSSAGRIETLIPSISADVDQFSVSFISADSKKEFTFTELNRAMQSGSKYIEAGNGIFGEIPQEWLRMYGARVEQILQALDANKKPLKAKLPQIADFCAEVGAECSESVERMRKQLVELSELPPFMPPADLRVELRDYQGIGARWLQCLKNWELGALLADDMGLGKTVQALSIIDGRTLVIAPTSVIHTWYDQASKFRPGLRVSLYWGAGREFDKNADLVITSYGVLRQDCKRLSEEFWNMIIVDESQAIKNPKSLTAQTVFSLRAKFRLAITGTPVENSLTDLWSQFNFILPGFLPGLNSSGLDFGLDSISDTDFSKQWDGSLLRKMIRPYLLRRKKEDVARELPTKTEETIFCELSHEERELYQTLLVALRKKVLSQSQSGESNFAVFEALLRLRQACCHSALVPGSELEASTKLDTLEAMLVNAVAEGHRAIVFSQWTSLLDRIEVRLKRSELSYLRLDGATLNRREIVADFQRPDGPSVLIMSLKAGGVGITLTAADYVFFCDPWWNPAAESQAEDRAHRIGQDKPVFVYRLVAKDTIEERVLALQEQKRALAECVLGGDDVGRMLSKDDLLELLE